MAANPSPSRPRGAPTGGASRPAPPDGDDRRRGNDGGGGGDGGAEEDEEEGDDVVPPPPSPPPPASSPARASPARSSPRSAPPGGGGGAASALLDLFADPSVPPPPLPPPPPAPPRTPLRTPRSSGSSAAIGLDLDSMLGAAAYGIATPLMANGAATSADRDLPRFPGGGAADVPVGPPAIPSATSPDEGRDERDPASKPSLHLHLRRTLAAGDRSWEEERTSTSAPSSATAAADAVEADETTRLITEGKAAPHTAAKARGDPCPSDVGERLRSELPQLRPTLLGSLLYSLYNLVFCFAEAAAIARPSFAGRDQALLSPMALSAAMGTLVAAPVLVGGLGGEYRAVYPCLDMFMAPFLGQMAADVDEILVQLRVDGGHVDDEYDDDDDASAFLATFVALNACGMLLSGILCALSNRVKLADAAGYLPYPVLSGFFSATFSGNEGGGGGEGGERKSRSRGVWLGRRGKWGGDCLAPRDAGAACARSGAAARASGIWTARRIRILPLGESEDDRTTRGRSPPFVRPVVRKKRDARFSPSRGREARPARPATFCAWPFWGSDVLKRASERPPRAPDVSRIRRILDADWGYTHGYSMRISPPTISNARCTPPTRGARKASKEMPISAFKVDTGTTVQAALAEGDGESLLMNFARHAPSVVAGAALYVWGPRGASYLIGIVSSTIAFAYLSMAATDTTLEEAQNLSFFWKPEEVMFPKDGNLFGFGPPAAFGLWSPKVLGKICWPAFFNGLSGVVAMSVIYLLRCSLHVAALKKLESQAKAEDSHADAAHPSWPGTMGDQTKKVAPKKKKRDVMTWYATSLISVAFSGGSTHPAIKSYQKSATEWIAVPVIVVTSLMWGMMQSVALGLGASTLIFVASFFRAGVVKFIANALTIRSTIERNHNDSLWLDQHGDLIQLMVLQNYLFFGNANSCLKYIRSMFDEDPDVGCDADLPPIPKYLILDLTIVTGIDTSAVDVLADISSLCRDNKCQLIFAGIPRVIRSALIKGGVKPSKANQHLSFSPDLEAALGKAEDELLKFVAHNEEKAADVGAKLRHQRKISSVDFGLRHALREIDAQHNLSLGTHLEALEKHTTPIEIEPGHKLNDAGGENHLPRGLYFVESGMLKCEHDSSASLTRGRSRSNLFAAPHLSSSTNSIGQVRARSETVGRCANLLKKNARIMLAQEHVFRLARVGPGWVIGTISEGLGQDIPGTYTALTPCRVHHLTFETIDELEIEQPARDDNRAVVNSSLNHECDCAYQTHQPKEDEGNGSMLVI
ncbi:hypothetical protein ACHAWF_013954 [Thalassiosira exigua]